MKLNTMRTAGAIALAGGLVAAFAYLYAGTQGADFAQETRIVADLRELEALDAEWTGEALRAKTGIDRRFAPGESPAERLPSKAQRVAQEVDAVGLPDASREFAAAREVFAQKADLTRRFADQNRILRESLLFVTDESADLLALLRVQERELRAQRSREALQSLERLSELGVRINELLTETLKYNLLTEPGALKRIESNLDDLGRLLPQYPADIAQPLEALISRLHGVQRIKAVEDRLLAEMAALPTQQRLAQTERAIEAGRKATLARIETHRTLLIAYSALLLALVAGFAWRLVHSWRLIRQKNAELADANDGLERRVTERTMELQDALAHLKESEAALVQSEKMSSLGQMIAGVAHEINTPLAYVRNGLQVLQEHVPHSAGLPEATRELLHLLASGDASEEAVAAQYERVAQMCEAAGAYGAEELEGVVRDGIHGIEQISEIVTNLKNFSRLDRSKVAHFSLNEGLESTLVIARNLVKAKRVVKQYDERAFVTGSPSQINQVFLNLLTNAAQATGPDGEIRITTRVEGDSAVVEVADNGSGIPADVLPRIFDPFFTTKKIGEGTGLGLSIAYKIVKEHGGTIAVDSQVGEGTRFTITLPVELAIVDAEREEAVHA